MPGRSLARLYKDEFSGYSPAKFGQDLLAGLTVAAGQVQGEIGFSRVSASISSCNLIHPFKYAFLRGEYGCAAREISAVFDAVPAGDPAIQDEGNVSVRGDPLAVVFAREVKMRSI